MGDAGRVQARPERPGLRRNGRIFVDKVWIVGSQHSDRKAGAMREKSAIRLLASVIYDHIDEFELTLFADSIGREFSRCSPT